MPSSQYAQFVRVCQLTEMVSTSTAWIICRRIGVQSGVYQKRTTRGERNNYKMSLKDHETMFYTLGNESLMIILRFHHYNFEYHHDHGR